jgi:U4/U6.U5 tri-snRNP-associated protein 1
MERSYNDIEDEEDLKERIKREDSQLQQISGTGLEEETTLDQGLGATLNMLKQRGLVKPSDAVEHNALLRSRQRFLHEKTHLETEAEKRARQQRERDRASGKLDRMSAREREEYARWENKQRDQQDARHMAEVFNKEYKPDVQLKYVDEFGRLMNQKEAFKHLSHQFHGKGSGRMKTEKRLKKIEEEKKREAMSALDSSQHTGMNNAMGATARKNRQAGVRLG